MFDEKQYQIEYRRRNKEALSASKKRYYHENKKILLENQKEWVRKNQSKVKQYRKQYRLENREKISKKSRDWYYNNMEKAKERVKRYTKERHEKYPWLKVFERIQSRVNHRKCYTQYGIKNYMTKEDVKYLWDRDCAEGMVMPSIDRIDGYGHYTLENCRFIELTDNLRRPRAWRKKDKSIACLGNTGRTHFKKGHIPWCKGKKRPEISGANHWTKR